MEVLAGLRAVDWVVAFTEDTPERLVQSIEPDTLVKGADYTVEKIAGSQHVLAKGGQVLTVELKPYCSSSLIIEKIKLSGEDKI
jgi:D-beta-D-heptose 7-phosphate kinase/D-beta-D-heptose 1-phosphate adenosyltransferase